MPELTDLVLIAVLTTALGVFVISSVVRAAIRKEMPEVVVGVPVWYYRPTDLVGAGMVFGIFAWLLVGTGRAPHAAVVEVQASTLMVNIGFQVLLAGALAILVVRRVGWVTWLGLRWSGWPWVFLMAPGAVAFMWVVFGVLQASGYMKWMESLGVETVQDTVKLLQQSNDPQILGLMAVAALIAAPLCEEVVFRGYLYPVMKKFAGAWPAGVCSALVFASAHGNLTTLLPLFLFGGVLVFIYERTGSLWAPIAVHCCFNSATVVVQFAARYYHLPLDATP